VAPPKAVGKRLGNHLDEPVKSGERTLILRSWRKKRSDELAYYVDEKE
jgi:hypothetical protein